MERIFCLLLGYFCGSFLFARLAAYFHGSSTSQSDFGNPGTANITAKYGPAWGTLVLLGDLGKTAAACALSYLLFGGTLGRLSVLYSGFGAVMGHNWPIWHQFRGGKGVAVTAAMSLLFSPLAGFLSYLGGGFAVLLSGYLAVGSAVIGILYPVLLLCLGYDFEPCLIAAAAGIFLLLRHRQNFRRILSHDEHRFDPLGLRRRFRH